MPAILEALAEHNPGNAGHRCKVGRWLDNLDGQPGHGDLVAAFDAPSNTGRTHAQLAAIANRLDHPISVRTISEHRARSCRCAW